MMKKGCKKLTKMLFACMLTLAMLATAASPVQAAGKATVKTVSGVKFQKGTGADKTKFEHTSASVNTGTYMMYLKNTASGKLYLISSKDGKKYSQTDLRATAKKQGVLNKKNTDSLWFGSMTLLGNEVAICGSYGEQQPCMLTTKNGKTFTFSEMPKFEEFSSGARILKVGSKYVWIRDFVEGYDRIGGERGLIQEGDQFKIEASYRYYISDDKRTWSPKNIYIKGMENGKEEILFYNDAKRKENKYLLLHGVMSDGIYLYFGITYRPHDEGNEGEISESYVYRTNDFETYEKVALSDQPLPKVTKNTAEHIEDLYLTRTDVRYGTVEDWIYKAGSSMDAFTLTRGSSAGNDFKTVFSYDAGAYSSKTNGYLLNWESTGKNVSLLFEREKDNSLFVSKDGKTGFKEYKTSIKPSQCCGIWEDAKKGYKILGYKKYTESDEMTHLLFSKNGFVKTYQVKLPSRTQSVVIKDDILSVTAQKGNYYLKLSDLYKKMK